VQSAGSIQAGRRVWWQSTVVKEEQHSTQQKGGRSGRAEQRRAGRATRLCASALVLLLHQSACAFAASALPLCRSFSSLTVSLPLTG